MLKFKQFFLSSLIDFCFPNFCVFCGIKTFNHFPVCNPCSTKIKPQSKLITENPNGFISKTWIPFEFTEEVSTLIHLLKYSEVTSVPKFFITFFPEELVSLLKNEDFDVLLPVPLHAVKQRERSYNQSELIADQLSHLINVKIATKILKRKRYTETQTKLDKKQREQNVKNVFEVSDKTLSLNKILLVDDVCTTGSTTNECAKTLLETKICKEVQLFALAKPKN
ncbi:ComF family protein [bacterium]|nr:ComF family protein [bacterium]